jgi:hypothetical protein
VITVGEVVHGLELLVNDPYAGLMSPVCYAVNILGSLSHCLELLVEALSGFDGGLGVEFSWSMWLALGPEMGTL